MPQALKPLCLIHFWNSENSLLLIIGPAAAAEADCSGGRAECEPRILSTTVNIFPAGPPRLARCLDVAKSKARFGDTNFYLG